MSKYTESGAKLPMNDLFAHLRDTWMKRGLDDPERRTTTRLAKVLDVLPQRVSQWATGTDATRGDPPWWVILTLCEMLNLEIRVNADEVSVVRRRRDPNSRAHVIEARAEKAE